LVAPGVVHGHAGFPVFSWISLGRDVLFGSLGVPLVASTEAVVPDEIGVLIEQRDDLSREGRRHVFGGGVEPDDGGKVTVVGKEFSELGNGLGMKIGLKAAILRFVPVIR